jgi:hypothetical protein
MKRIRVVKDSQAETRGPKSDKCSKVYMPKEMERNKLKKERRERQKIRKRDSGQDDFPFTVNLVQVYRVAG